MLTEQKYFIVQTIARFTILVCLLTHIRPHLNYTHTYEHKKCLDNVEVREPYLAVRIPLRYTYVSDIQREKTLNKVSKRL